MRFLFFVFQDKFFEIFNNSLKLFFSFCILLSAPNVLAESFFSGSGAGHKLGYRVQGIGFGATSQWFIIKLMIYTITGKLAEKSEDFLVVECGGIGFKIFTNLETLRKLAVSGSGVKIFCFSYIREDKFDLYGFLDEQTLKLFEMLNGVSGVGPRTALALLDLDTVERVMAAILEKKVELLTRASGIGKKTAERIVLELSEKIKMPKSGNIAKDMNAKAEAEEALVQLGYQRSVVKNVLSEIDIKSNKIEDIVREAFKKLGTSR